MLAEKDLLATIKAALAIRAIAEVLDAMTQLADIYIKQGLTQEGADVLAYVLRCEAVADDTRDHAHDSWEDLARYICPRVLLDAEEFAALATFDDMVEYIFA